jgi:imidazolonepropionase-like amidohydrolase
MSGQLGVIKPGAKADLLLVKGNPLNDISCLLGQGENILSIMKDGKFYKQG